MYSLDDGYDIVKYTEMTLKAVETLLFPFGCDAETLKNMWYPVPPRIKRPVGRRHVRDQGELFDQRRGKEEGLER